MPKVSSFFGISIYMFYDDHPVPHFHAEHQGEVVEVAIRDLTVSAGAITPRAMGLVVEWAAQHRDELAENWLRAERHQPLLRIAGLA